MPRLDNKRDFLEAYQVREALEALGVRLAVPRLTGSALDAMDEELLVMTRHAAAGDVDAFFDTNARFHEAFVEASGNRKLVETYRRLMAQMGPYRRPSARLRGNVERSIAEHRAIVAAARRRDVDKAVAQIIRHVEVPQRLLERMSDEEFARAVTGSATS
jgi:DNA-binding GntR family transcriptional regulator